jgi:hypothetical protein
MYTCRYILLVFIKVAIQTRYTYKRYKTRRKHTENCCKLPSPQLPSTHVLHCRRRRRVPVVGPDFEAEETPCQEALLSRDSDQPRKAGSSPIRNIGRRSHPSLFNAGSRASAIPPLSRWLNPLPSSAFRRTATVTTAALRVLPISATMPRRSARLKPLQLLGLHKPLVDASSTSDEQEQGPGDKGIANRAR